MKLLRKIKAIPKLIKNEGLDAFYFRVLINLGFKLKYRSIIEKQKYLLQEKIKKLTKKKVISGLYKNLELHCKSNWDNYSFSSKLLGVYEEQIQLKIQELSIKYKLENIIQLGSADGYHILGLVKNNILKNAYGFEMDRISYEYSLENKKVNGSLQNVKVFNEEANLELVEKFLPEVNLKKTVFLIDIESAEYDLFTNENIDKYKKSFFVIEDHFFYDHKNRRNHFLELVKDNFNWSFIQNSMRNPFKFKILNNFNDDDKWLLMGEGRPQSMSWLILEPK
tara:strand:- start:2305 stop:3144 length:840 start_codon:yes stop_codon:yes gene_type:complete